MRFRSFSFPKSSPSEKRKSSSTSKNENFESKNLKNATIDEVQNEKKKFHLGDHQNDRFDVPPLCIGEKVIIKDSKVRIIFLNFCKERIVLDDKNGKNNGTVDGIKYFDALENSGIFVLKSNIDRVFDQEECNPAPLSNHMSGSLVQLIPRRRSSISPASHLENEKRSRSKSYFKIRSNDSNSSVDLQSSHHISKSRQASVNKPIKLKRASDPHNPRINDGEDECEKKEDGGRSLSQRQASIFQSSDAVGRQISDGKIKEARAEKELSEGKAIGFKILLKERDEALTNAKIREENLLRKIIELQNSRESTLKKSTEEINSSSDNNANIHDLQHEITSLTAKLNEKIINQVKYQTKIITLEVDLEELENLRKQFNDLEALHRKLKSEQLNDIEKIEKLQEKLEAKTEIERTLNEKLDKLTQENFIERHKMVDEILEKEKIIDELTKNLKNNTASYKTSAIEVPEIILNTPSSDFVQVVESESYKSSQNMKENEEKISALVKENTKLEKKIKKYRTELKVAESDRIELLKIVDMYGEKMKTQDIEKFEKNLTTEIIGMEELNKKIEKMKKEKKMLEKKVIELQNQLDAVENTPE
ncbi:hypothetical protein HK096_004659, partial [Nowakowskiella sp. JEL0078]